ncbi:tetratricopeptide repeat protein [Aureispira anguillae]|uniref:CDC27 family protein n=1 Tax=Aureispira anguillae TaxID=2864201 RepID=A0A915YGH0_9BACT|nr:CDC27 family protein [Aureispira anguillae]BDS12528.1 CDC27 family protein [Aureispira anguillae]
MSRITVFKLHDLIKSLKKEEKRSFKLFTKRYNLNGDSVYLKVFDYLDKVKTIDLDKFKKKFKETKGISAIQTYLYQQILKSLRNQEAYRNVDLILMEGLAELEVLFSKNLLDVSKEKLLELQKIAEEHHKILLLPLIYEWWFKLENTRFKYDNVSQELFEEYKQKYNNTFLILKEYANYRIELGQMVFAINGKYSRQLFDVAQGIIANLGPYQPNSMGSVPTEIASLQLRAFLAAITRNREEAERYQRYLYNFTKTLSTAISKDYKRIQYQALGSLIINAPTVDIAIPLLEAYDRIEAGERKYLTNTTFLSIVSTQIQVYLSTGDFKKSEAYINALKLEKEYPNHTIYCIVQYQLALCQYANKNYDQALQILDGFLFSKRSHERSNSYGMMLKIIILYEQGEYLMLSSLMNNTRRSFKRKGTLFEFEKMLISLMNRLIRLPQSEHQANLRAFKDKLKAFLMSLPNYQKEFLLYFNYWGWLDYLITKQPFKKLCYWSLESIENELLE